MLKISFVASEATINALRTKGSRIVSVLSTKLTTLMYQLAGYVQAQKLTGQVLAVRTGILRSSVRAIPTRAEGGKLIGEVTAGGGPAFYAAVHEFGGRSSFSILPVKARALSWISGGNRVYFSRVMHPPLPRRAFLEPSLLENEAKIRAELQAAVDAAVNE